LDHVLFPEVADYHLRFRLLEENRHFPWSEDIQFHMLELPKFTKAAHPALRLHGARGAMLSSVLHRDRAIKVNIAIMRAFVKLRQILATHKDLASKLDALERKLGQHDEKSMPQMVQRENDACLDKS